MTAIKCPSGSLAEVSSSGGSTILKPRHSGGRVRSHNDLPNEAELALKKVKRDKLVAAKAPFEKNNKLLMSVYVGGLSSETTEYDLARHFADCGPLGSIIIRQGVCLEEDQPNLNYASVEFRDSNAYRFALRRDGSELNGFKITVGLSALDLPDAKRIERRYESSRASSNKPLRREPTEIINPFPA